MAINQASKQASKQTKPGGCDSFHFEPRLEAKMMSGF